MYVHTAGSATATAAATVTATSRVSLVLPTAMPGNVHIAFEFSNLQYIYT
jgi:hypothetical protein